MELRVGVKRHVCFAYIAKSKSRSKKKLVINLDHDVQVCGDNFFSFGWMVYELLFMNDLSPLFFLDVGYLFLFFSLSFF